MSKETPKEVIYFTDKESPIDSLIKELKRVRKKIKAKYGKDTKIICTAKGGQILSIEVTYKKEK